MSSVNRAHDLGLKAVPGFDALPDEVLDYYEQHPNQIPDALARGFAILETKMDKAHIELTPAFAVVATIRLGRVAGKKTIGCFTDWRWSNHGYRADKFDDWLGASQPATNPCIVSALAPSHNWTFGEAAAKVLGVNANTPIATLGWLLIKRGHTLTLAQVGAMVPTKRQESSIFACAPSHSFFFVETGNSKDPVVVGDVRYEAEGDYLHWFAYLHRLAYDDDYDDRAQRCNAGDKLLLSNLDTTKFRT